MKAELLNVEKPIAAYNEFRSQLNELQAGNAKAVFDYESPKGNKEARSHVYKLRQTKASVEKVRKAEKAVALEYGRKVDNEAKEIVAVITDMMAVHEKPLAEIEQREAERVKKHTDLISWIEETGAQFIDVDGQILPASHFESAIKEVEAVKIGKQLEEFASDAAIAKDEALASLKNRLAERQKHEAEQAELAAMRKEAEEREARERDERLQREAAESARAEAEAKAEVERNRVAEEAKAEREAAERAAKEAREAAERRELEHKLAIEKSERERIEADQRAANAARETEERLAREAKEKAAAEAAEQAKRDANKKHVAGINREALSCFMEAGGFTEKQAKEIVTLIAKGVINNVSIKY